MLDSEAAQSMLTGLLEIIGCFLGFHFAVLQPKSGFFSEIIEIDDNF
jgi:hypothetical protein